MIEGRSTYAVKLKSHLDAGWLKQLPAESMTVGYEQALPVTTITLNVVDQAELVGVLSEMHGLGLRLLSIIYISHEPAGKPAM